MASSSLRPVASFAVLRGPGALCRRLARTALAVLLPLLSACTALTGVDPTAGFWGTTTTSPVAGAREIAQPDWMAATYTAATACITAHGGTLRSIVVPLRDVHIFVTDSAVFANPLTGSPVVAYAWGHTLTIGRINVTPATFGHELGHLLTVELGNWDHRAPFWAPCGWLVPSVIIG